MLRSALKHIIITLTAVLCLAVSSMTAFAAETITLPVAVEFGQTDARAMLDMINDFRTGSDAWYWNSSNTEKVYVKADKLTYDYGLEQIAMQRAVEIALSFAHTRPNGGSCFTASVGSYTAYGENIAAGTGSLGSVRSIFTSLQETDLPYAGQGHRRNMLNEGFTCVGIAHVYVNGCHYWAQEFGIRPSGVAPTAANDGDATVNVEIDRSMTTKFTVEAPKTLALSLGDSVSAPTANVKIAMQNTWPGTPVTVPVTPSWTVSGSAVTLSGGKITAVNVGSSTLTATVYGEKVTLTVNVECTNHKWGNWTTKKAATCTDKGTETRQCTVCKTEESRTVEATGHKMGAYTVTKAATCTGTGVETRKCTVCKTEESRTIPATGHKMGSYTVTKAATCTETGVETRKCTVCKTEESRTIAATGHKMGSYKVIKAATEDADGLEERSCAVCGETEQRVIAKLPPASTGETAASTETSSPEVTVPPEITASSEETASPEVTTPSEGPTAGEVTTPNEETVSGGDTTSNGGTPSENTPDSDKPEPEKSPVTSEEGTQSSTPEQTESDGQTDGNPAQNNTAPDPDRANDGGDHTLVYIVIAVVGVLAAGGICGFFVLRARKRK